MPHRRLGIRTTTTQCQDAFAHYNRYCSTWSHIYSAPLAYGGNINSVHEASFLVHYAAGSVTGRPSTITAVLRLESDRPLLLRGSWLEDSKVHKPSAAVELGPDFIDLPLRTQSVYTQVIQGIVLSAYTHWTARSWGRDDMRYTDSDDWLGTLVTLPPNCHHVACDCSRPQGSV